MRRLCVLTLLSSSSTTLLSACPTPATVAVLASRLGVGAAIDARAPEADTDTLRALLDDCRDDGPAPPLPPLPTTRDPLPAACDEAARIDAVVAACGALQPAIVLQDGDAIDDGLARCGAGTCRLSLPAGTFFGEATAGCVVIEGVGDDTIVDGALSFMAPAVLARVRVQDEYGALSATSDLLVNEAVVVGGYEGFGAAWDQAIDVAICRSQIAAGYSGIGLSWATRRLTVAGNGIATCYEGVGVSWGSSDVLVTQNVIAAKYAGVSIHQSRAVAVLGNVLYGEYDAVGISSFDDGGGDAYDIPVSDVLIRGNDIRGGALPASDEGADILVDQ